MHSKWLGAMNVRPVARTVSADHNAFLREHVLVAAGNGSVCRSKWRRAPSASTMSRVIAGTGDYLSGRRGKYHGTTTGRQVLIIRTK